MDDTVHYALLTSVANEQEVKREEAYQEERINDLQAELSEMAEDYLAQVKQFLYILYGSCVRFYSTVLDPDILEIMKEDLIEVLTSKLFDNSPFSRLVLSLCRETTREQELALQKRLRVLYNLKPKDIGISPYLTLDESSNILQVYKDLHYENVLDGDSGASASHQVEELPMVRTFVEG